MKILIAAGACALLTACSAISASDGSEGRTLGYTAPPDAAAPSPTPAITSAEDDMQRQMREATQEAARQARELARQLRESDTHARQQPATPPSDPL